MCKPAPLGGLHAVEVATPLFVDPPPGILQTLLAATAPQQPEILIRLNDEEVAARDIANIIERPLLPKNRRFAPTGPCPRRSGA